MVFYGRFVFTVWFKIAVPVGDKTCARKGNLLCHYRIVHGGAAVQNQVTKSEKEQDYQYNYVRSALPLLLLRTNHNDAIKYADGDRLERCHLYLLPYYKVTSCPK
jgi:hypothetical protein